MGGSNCMTIIIENESQRRRFMKKAKSLGISINHPVVREFPYRELIVATSHGKYALPLNTNEEISISSTNSSALTVKMLENTTSAERI